MYTLIGYKPNSSDYCRGCHMDSYSSAFLFQGDLSKEELIKSLSLSMAEEFELGYNEIAMKYMVLKDGKSVYDSIEESYLLALYDEEGEFNNSLYNEVDAIIKESHDKAEIIKQQKQIAKDARIKREELKRRDDELKEAERRLEFIKSRNSAAQP